MVTFLLQSRSHSANTTCLCIPSIVLSAGIPTAKGQKAVPSSSTQSSRWWREAVRGSYEVVNCILGGDAYYGENIAGKHTERVGQGCGSKGFTDDT